MLEALARETDLDLDLMAQNLLKEEERPVSEKDSLIAIVRTVVASELWKRMRSSAENLLEVPFSLRIEGEEPPKIVSGAIDLAFKEPDGWVIADYKTDKVDGRLEGLIKHYTPQVMMYKDFWEKMSGEKVKEAGIFFVDTGKWVPVN